LAATELRADREIVLEAVRQYWRALVFATEELRADREFVLEVAKHGRDALVFAAVELRADREIVLEAVKRNGHALEFAAEELRADPEVVLEAVKQDRGAIVYAAEELRLATRVVQLVAESAGADVSVRCLSMGGEEMAVLQCAPELAARKLVGKIKTALPLGLGRLVLVLPDGSRLDVDDLDAEALEPLQNLLGEIRARKKKRSNGGDA
jgi:hypothetical protein